MVDRIANAKAHFPLVTLREFVCLYFLKSPSLSLTKISILAGLMKLFLHEVLPDDVEKAIYVDTDAFFLTDPALLWEEFSHWGPDVAVSIPYHPNEDSPNGSTHRRSARVLCCLICKSSVPCDSWTRAFIVVTAPDCTPRIFPALV
jgi:hypothetical protein